eukprot:CAMPEP_0182417144 /NCGR_PEP_ID=MMETSP1167-20130531/1549_1 /TAXON_ID=2988 /ORGANISM="Mallomonas Sp, Strain CCMP3275" /LENGTH=257 /DNA_ID=CAMNT_0024590473 /DNA_START=346 /DNA_END=1116 /DNA_ORIENTATION=-
MLVVVIPFSIFYYEADDGSLTGEEKKSKFCSALKYQICIFIGTAAILLSTYFTSSLTSIPVKDYTVEVNDMSVLTITVQSKGLNPYNYIDTSYRINPLITKSTSYIQFSVNFPVYIIALMSWVGWWVFSVFAGFGMAAIPFDFILGFTNRPRVLTADEIAEIQIQLQDRTADLMDIGVMMKRARAEFKRTATSASEQRLRWGKDRLEVNKLEQMIYVLEGDIEQLNACKIASQDNNSLIPYLKLLLGLLTACTSILW